MFTTDLLITTSFTLFDSDKKIERKATNINYKLEPEKKLGVVVMINSCDDEVITKTLNLLLKNYAKNKSDKV